MVALGARVVLIAVIVAAKLVVAVVVAVGCGSGGDDDAAVVDSIVSVYVTFGVGNEVVVVADAGVCSTRTWAAGVPSATTLSQTRPACGRRHRPANSGRTWREHNSTMLVPQQTMECRRPRVLGAAARRRGAPAGGGCGCGSVAMRVVGTVCGARQTGASRSSRVSSRSHKQRTNNARTAHEQRTSSVRTACKQRVRTRTQQATLI